MVFLSSTLNGNSEDSSDGDLTSQRRRGYVQREKGASCVNQREVGRQKKTSRIGGTNETRTYYWLNGVLLSLLSLPFPWGWVSGHTHTHTIFWATSRKSQAHASGNTKSDSQGTRSKIKSGAAGCEQIKRKREGERERENACGLGLSSCGCRSVLPGPGGHDDGDQVSDWNIRRLLRCQALRLVFLVKMKPAPSASD